MQVVEGGAESSKRTTWSSPACRRGPECCGRLIDFSPEETGRPWIFARVETGSARPDLKLLVAALVALAVHVVDDLFRPPYRRVVLASSRSRPRQPRLRMCTLAIASLAVSACNVNRTLASDGDAALPPKTSTSAPGGSRDQRHPDHARHECHDAAPDHPQNPPPPTPCPPPRTAPPTPRSRTAGSSEAATTLTLTGEPSLFGKCGWVLRSKYYACDVDGGTPGLVDPDGISPIDCADGLVEGEPCDDRNGPVNGVGCCTPAGVLFFCDTFGRGIISSRLRSLNLDDAARRICHGARGPRSRSPPRSLAASGPTVLAW